MRTKEFHENSGSEFGKRVLEMEPEKERIAEAVLKYALWQEALDPKNPIFLSDGSSASYVWCHYLRAWAKNGPAGEALIVKTNNLDVPMQVLCEPGAHGRVNIEDAPGDFSFKFCANFGSDTDAWVEKKCSGCTCILAVTSLDAELGPGSKDPRARAIKRAVMETANVLVIVADRTKLSKPRNPADAANPNAWKIWRDQRANEGRLFVVTDQSPEVTHPYKRTPFKGFPDARTPLQIENENTWWLREHLGKQFIVV